VPGTCAHATARQGKNATQEQTVNTVDINTHDRDNKQGPIAYPTAPFVANGGCPAEHNYFRACASADMQA